MKKAKRIIPIAITLIISLTVGVLGWVINDATMSGIRITSSKDGVTLRIKLSNDYQATPSDTLNVNMDLNLKPCRYVDGAFFDEDGNIVNNNNSFVRKFTVQVTPSQRCLITASKEVEGDLPVNVICNEQQIVEGTTLGEATNITALTLYFYVDGENFSGSGSSNVTITFHGEAV